MATDKQREANRRNAQRSTGPKSPEGKDRARYNALTHGLRSGFLDVLPGEDREAFAARLDQWRTEHRPTTGAEDHLVRQAVILSWKIDRIDRYEVAVVWDRVYEAFQPFLDGPLDDSDALDREFVKTAALASFDPSNDGERLRRYQLSLQRALIRTLDALAKLRAQHAKAWAADEKTGANEANSAEPGRLSAEGSSGAGGPSPSKSTPEDRPETLTNEANSPDLADDRRSISATIETSLAQLRTVSSTTNPKRPIRLDLADSPIDALCTPWYKISCLKS